MERAAKKYDTPRGEDESFSTSRGKKERDKEHNKMADRTLVLAFQAASADVAGSKTSSEAADVFGAAKFTPATTASSTTTGASSPSRVDVRMVASSHNLDDLSVNHPASANSDPRSQQQQEKHGHAYRSAQTAQDKRSRLSNVINNLRKKVPDTRDSPRKEEDDRNSVERNLETLEKYVMTVLNGVIKDEEDDDDDREALSKKKEAASEKSNEAEKLPEDQEDEEDSKGPAAKFEPSRPNESRTEAAVVPSEQPDKPEAKEFPSERQKKVDKTESSLKKEEFNRQENINEVVVSEEKKPKADEEEDVCRIDRRSFKEAKSEEQSVLGETARSDEDERKENRSLGTIIMERLSESQFDDKSNVDSVREDCREQPVSDNAELRNVCRDLLNDLLNGINQLIDENSQEKEQTRSSENSMVDSNSRDSRTQEFSMTSLHCSLPLDKVASVLQSCQTAELAVPQSPLSSSSSSSSSQGSKSPCKPPSPTVRHLCLYCDRKFMSISLRQRHTERVHQHGGGRRSERNSRKPSQNCQYCSDKCAESLEGLFQHMVGSHGDKYHGCLQCSTRYLTREALAGHMSENHGVSVERNLQIQEKMKESSPCKEQGNQNPRDAPNPKERRSEDTDHEHRTEPTNILLKPVHPAKDNFSNPGSPEFDNISLTAATPVYSKEYGTEEYENNSEYAQKPGKSNRSHPRRVSFEKYNFPRKYDGKEQWTCSIKDLSKFDISTQLSLRKKQQLLKEHLSLSRLQQITLLAAASEVAQNEQSLNSRDLEETAVEVDKPLDVEQVLVASEAKRDVSEKQLQETEFTVEFGNFLRLRKWDETTTSEAAKKQETVYAELTGEWSRPRVYVCGTCASKHGALQASISTREGRAHGESEGGHLGRKGVHQVLQELYHAARIAQAHAGVRRGPGVVAGPVRQREEEVQVEAVRESQQEAKAAGNEEEHSELADTEGERTEGEATYGAESQAQRQGEYTKDVGQLTAQEGNQEGVARHYTANAGQIAHQRNRHTRRSTTKASLPSVQVQTRTRPRLVGENSSVSRMSRNKAALRNKLLKNAKSIQRNRCRIDNISAVIESVVRNYAPDLSKPTLGEGVETREANTARTTDPERETKEKTVDGCSAGVGWDGAPEERGNRAKTTRGPRVLGKKRNVKTKDGTVRSLDQAKRTSLKAKTARTVSKIQSEAKTETFGDGVRTSKAGKACPRSLMEKEAETEGTEASPGEARSPSLKSSSKSSTQSGTPKRKRPVDPVASLNASIKAKSQLRTQDGKFARNPNKESASPHKSPELRCPVSGQVLTTATKERGGETSPESSITRSKLRAVSKCRNGDQSLPKRTTRLSSDSDKMPTLEPAVRASSPADEYPETSANDLPILSPVTPASAQEKSLRGGKALIGKCLNDKENVKKQETQEQEKRTGSSLKEEEKEQQKQGKGRRAKNDAKSLNKTAENLDAKTDVSKEVKKLIGSDSKEDLLTKLVLTTRIATSKRCLRQPASKFKFEQSRSKSRKVDPEVERALKLESGSTSDASTKKEKLDARRKSLRKTDRKDTKNERTVAEEANRTKDSANEVKSAARGRRSSSLTNESKSLIGSSQPLSPFDVQTKSETSASTSNAQNADKRQTRGSTSNSGEGNAAQSEDSSLKKNALGKRRGRVKSNNNDLSDRRNIQEACQTKNEETEVANDVDSTEAERDEAKLAKEENEKKMASTEREHSKGSDRPLENRERDSGKENSVARPAPVQKLKVGRPRKSWGARKEQASKKSLNNVVGILTEGINIPVDAPPSVLSTQTGTDNAESGVSLQTATPQADDDASKTPPSLDKSVESSENTVSEVLATVPDKSAADSPCVRRISNEKDPKQTEAANDQNLEKIRRGESSSNEDQEQSPANDIILDLSRRKQKGKGSFLERIVSKIAKQKDALLEGEVGSLLDTAVDELTSILNEVGPTFSENAETSSETRTATKAEKIGDTAQGSEKVEKSADESCPSRDSSVQNEENEGKISMELASEFASRVDNSNDEEAKDESKVTCKSEEIADQEIDQETETKLPMEEQEETSFEGDEKENCIDRSKEQDGVVPAETSSATNNGNKVLSPAVENTLEIPASNVADAPSSRLKREKEKHEEVAEEGRVKRRSKKRSLEGKSKKKTTESTDNSEESVVSDELHPLADSTESIEKSKQVPSAEENVPDTGDKPQREEPGTKGVDAAENFSEIVTELAVDPANNTEERTRKNKDEGAEQFEDVADATKTKEEIEATSEEKNSSRKRKCCVEEVDSEVQAPVSRRSYKRRSYPPEEEKSKEKEESSSAKNSEETNKEQIGQTASVEQEKTTEEAPAVAVKVPKKRGRKKKCLTIDQTQSTQPTVSRENPKHESIATSHQLPPRRSRRTNRLAEETESQSKNFNHLANLQEVPSSNVEPFKVPEVTELLLQHTKKRTYKRRSTTDENSDVQSNCPRAELEAGGAECSEERKSSTEKEDQSENLCQKDPLEEKKHAPESEHVDLERSSSVGSLDLMDKTEQIGKTRTSKRKQLSSEDLSEQGRLSQRQLVESADNLSETSCVSDFSYLRRKRYSKKRKELRASRREDTSATDSESVERSTDRRQILKRRAKKNIFFAEFYLMDDFDIPMDIPDCVSVEDDDDEEEQEEEGDDDDEDDEDEDEDEDELKNEDQIDEKLDGLSQTQDDFQSTKKKAAGNYVVVHKKTGEILIVEKRKKLTKEAARFFCNVCTTSFTRKSSLKKHSQSQAHLLQMVKSKKNAAEDDENAEDLFAVSQNDVSSDENRAESADEATNVLSEPRDDQENGDDATKSAVPEPLRSDLCYSSHLEQNSLMNSPATHQHTLEDELLDEEICKITENMNHDEYVITDQVSSEPESVSTPVKMEVMAVEDVGKRKRHEKKKEKAKKVKSLIDEQILLDSPELGENPTDDDTLVSVLGANMSIKIAKSSCLNASEANVARRDAPESSFEESRTDILGTREDDFQEPCLDGAAKLQENRDTDVDMEIEDALLRTEVNKIVEDTSTYKVDPEERNDDFSSVRLDDTDTERNQPYERLSLKLTINARGIEVCKDTDLDKCDYSSAFVEKSEDVTRNCEKNHESARAEPIENCSYVESRTEGSDEDSSSSTPCESQRGGRKSLEHNIDELDVASKVQRITETLENAKDQQAESEEQNKSGETPPCHGRSRRVRAKRQSEETEINSEGKATKRSPRSKVEQNELATKFSESTEASAIDRLNTTLEDRIKSLESIDDDEASSSSSLADKPLSQILLEREQKLDAYKEIIPCSMDAPEDSANESKPESKSKVENERTVDDDYSRANEPIENEKPGDKDSNVDDEQTKVASEEEASKTTEDNSDKDSKISSESENSEAVPPMKNASKEKELESEIIGNVGRKSSASKRANKSHRYASAKDSHRRARGRKSSIRSKLADLSSESDDSENEGETESQNKSKIVKSVFGRVFGGEKADKVKEVLNDWVFNSEDDSDISRTCFKYSGTNEARAKDCTNEKNGKRHSVSSSNPRKRPGKRSKKNSSLDRAKEKKVYQENQVDEHHSGRHVRSKSSNSKKKHDTEASNSYFLHLPATKCRLSKKRAEELISRTFEDDFTETNVDKSQRSRHKEPNYGLRNQGKPDLTIKDSGYGSFNYDEDSSKMAPMEDTADDEQQKMIKRRRMSDTKRGRGKSEEESWQDLVEAEKKASKNPKESDDEEDSLMKNVHRKRSQLINRLSVDLEESSRTSCSSLAPSSVRNRSPSMDRNSQTTRDSDVDDDEEDEDAGHGRISPLFVCGTPRSSVETSSNSENEEEGENLVANDAVTRKSSSEFSGEKIVIRLPQERRAAARFQGAQRSMEGRGKSKQFGKSSGIGQPDIELGLAQFSNGPLCKQASSRHRNYRHRILKHSQKEQTEQTLRVTKCFTMFALFQLLGEEMYSTRERDYAKRGGRNLRSEHSSRSASPDTSRADNLGYEDSLDVAFEHNNKLRDKIQQRMRESENLIASTFSQKSSNDIVRGQRTTRNNELDILTNSYSRLQDQKHLPGPNLSNGGYNEPLHVKGLQDEHGAKVNLDSSGLKGKMNSSLGGLLDKALSNLLHSNEKHDHNGSTPMKVLAELACARAPTTTSEDPALQESAQFTKTTLTKDATPNPSLVPVSKDLQKKSRNPIKELFERKKEMNERKQQEKSKNAAEAALKELNVHRQRKTKKTKKHQDFPLIRRNEHGGLVERKKRRDGFERKEEFASDRIKDVYEFDEEESQIEPNLGSVMSYRSRPGYEVSCLRTKEVDVAGLMSKAIGDTLENGKTADALSTRLESMIDRKFKELEKFAPKTKGALKAFQSEDQQRQITGPMDEFVERKQPTKASKKLAEQTTSTPTTRHPKLKKRSKNSKKKARNSWYENDSSDEYRTAVKTEDVGVGISKSQRTCSKGKQNIFAELYTSSESEFEDEDADYESKRQKRVKKNSKKEETELENVEQSQELVGKYTSDNEDQADDWKDQDSKNDVSKHDCDNKKSESEMSDHPLVIDERKDVDEQRNSDDETENQYERNFEMDDLYREDSSIVDSDVEDLVPTVEPAKVPEEVRMKSPSLSEEKTDAEKAADYMQGSELIPLEEALDLLDQADNENSLGAKYGDVARSAKPNDCRINPVVTVEPENETFNSVDDADLLDKVATASPTPVEEQEEEPDDDLPALPEKLSSNEKPQKESENLPLHPTRRQRKCAIGKQGLLAEISSSDEEISPRDRRVNDRPDHDKPRKQKRESKEKRKERYIEKKHEQMIAKEQKAIEEEILREVGKKKESLAQNNTDAKNIIADVNGTKKPTEDTESAENKMPQEPAQKKKHQAKEKQKKQAKTDEEDSYVKNNHEGLSDLENNCNKPPLTETNREIAENNQESPAKQKKHFKSPTKPRKTPKSDQKVIPVRKSKNSNVDRKAKTDSKGTKDKERRSSSGKLRDSDDEELKTTKSWNKVEEGVGVAIGRRKRAAANQLYYWSSSSDEEEMLEMVPAVEEEEDDRQEQHGWIVGDSHKRMITMLAMEKQLKEKRRRSEDEFEPGRTKSKKHRNSTS
ncbi:hypothetical protein WN51_14458 [Melipona quadrifasciata]|uniref:C2H2-type domain-containing protein n=1 Tax=Melipona quadrifasciata TaxID=166423 RepID=A0A0N0BFI8_9HYME|nr:hypothetical protein WN51_14458 [Melipona quadrifasciata]